MASRESKVQNIYFSFSLSFFSPLLLLLLAKSKNMSSLDESQPLLKGHAQESNKAYDGILVRNIDEEHLVNNDTSSSSSSSQTTIDEHDPEYIVQNRLGDTSLTMITIW